MSQVACDRIRGLIALLFIVVVAGCTSTPNDQSVLNPDTGKHAANWYVDHRTTFLANPSQCTECHGNDLRGGISQVSCFSADLNGMSCHANGPAPHLLPFTDPALHGPAAKTNLIYCQGCHANPPASGAGSNPRFNVALGSLANGCEDCHAINTAHPVPWRGTLPLVIATSHATAANMLNACALCHGATLGGGAGPACTSCHTAGNPLSFSNCTSCHGNPPDGTASPNIAGQHAVHVALGSYIICDTCHSGAGTGTLNHDYVGGVVNVAFLSAYSAASGTASFDATANTCTNISCHGGSRTQDATQAGLIPPGSTVTQTPSWLTGAINVNTDCVVCHVLGSAAGNPENNSYYSGQHNFHVYTQGFACTICHDAVDPLKLAANHFTHLDTAVMEGPASATIVSSLTLTYTPGGTPGTGSCVATCHTSPTVPRNW